MNFKQWMQYILTVLLSFAVLWGAYRYVQADFITMKGRVTEITAFAG